LNAENIFTSPDRFNTHSSSRHTVSNIYRYAFINGIKSALSELVSDAARKDAVKTLWEQVEPGGLLVSRNSPDVSAGWT
jgi:hypothetical protein